VPTILNAALQFKAHWRGDRENVEDEAKQVLIGSFSFINPDYASATARIKAIPGYADLFRKEFSGDPDPSRRITGPRRSARSSARS